MLNPSQASRAALPSESALDLAPHWSAIPKGGDVSDYLDAGHSREQLDKLIAEAPEWRPQGETADAPPGRQRHVRQPVNQAGADAANALDPAAVTVRTAQPEEFSAVLVVGADLLENDGTTGAD